MASEWRTITLGDFVVLQRGHDLTAEERRAGNVPVFGAAGHNGYHDTAIAKGPGIVVGRSGGSFGQVHYSKEDFWPHNTGLYVKDFKGNDPRFAFYLLTALDFDSYNSGSAQPSLNRNFIYPIPVRVPPPAEQKAISRVLSNLDDKIELNHRINAELEGMAKLLYDYWFVQFEFPLSAAQAKAMGNPRLAGKPYKSSGGRMTFAPELKREIPDGWEVGNLLDIATFTNGIACQKYPQTDEAFLRVIKIKEMRDGFTDTSETVTPEVPEKVIVNDGDILFSWSASLEVMIWAGGTGALNQHIFKVTSQKYPRSYCYFTLVNYLQHFKMLADLRKTTMGHITREHLEQSRIAIPPGDLTKSLESKLNPILAQVVNHHQQNQELTTLRDWLLPLLMNGQVTFR